MFCSMYNFAIKLFLLINVIAIWNAEDSSQFSYSCGGELIQTYLN